MPDPSRLDLAIVTDVTVAQALEAALELLHATGAIARPAARTPASPAKVSP